MRALMFSIAMLGAGWVAPSSAVADVSVSDGVQAQCAASAFDAATCGRLARIAGELVDSEVVGEALAAEVVSLPAEQGEWLAQALDAQARAAEYEHAQAQDEFNAFGDRDSEVLGSSDDGATMGGEAAEPPAPPPPPQQSALLRALEKARDYIRRAISGRG
ncbi:MAG: hypothetical protein ABL883_02625 [Terricaulis sp.]